MDCCHLKRRFTVTWLRKCNAVCLCSHMYSHTLFVPLFSVQYIILYAQPHICTLLCLTYKITVPRKLRTGGCYTINIIYDMCLLPLQFKPSSETQLLIFNIISINIHNKLLVIALNLLEQLHVQHICWVSHTDKIANSK